SRRQRHKHPRARRPDVRGDVLPHHPPPAEAGLSAPRAAGLAEEGRRGRHPGRAVGPHPRGPREGADPRARRRRARARAQVRGALQGQRQRRAGEGRGRLEGREEGGEVMDRSWWTRLWIVIGVILLTLWFLIPTYVTYFVVPAEQRNDVEAIQAKLPAWAPSANRRLNLGLDLQGGIHMVMRVDTQTALQKRAERRAIQ